MTRPPRLPFDDPPSAASTRPRPPRPTPRDPTRWLLALAFTFASASLILLIGLLVLLIEPAPPTPITLVIDGAALPFNTYAQTVGDALREANLDPAIGDQVDPAPETLIQANLIIRVDRARSVTLVVDGDARLLWTSLTSPADILALAEVTLTQGDRVIIDGTQIEPQDVAAYPVPASQISVRRVVPITVTVDEESPRMLETTRDTVGEALYDAGITVYVADTLSVDLNAPVYPGMAITIRRARPVTVLADGQTVRARAQGETVADALAEAGIALVGLDYTIPPVSARLIPGMSIRVIRVREELEATTVTIPYETVYQADAALELDQVRVLQNGAEGVETTRIRVRYENDIAISREIESVEITSAVQNHVIGYGTNVVIRSIDTPTGAVQYYRVLRMYATSYHPAALGGDSTTATGARLQHGVIGANPNLLPYHTQIFVPGYGVGSIEDTGGARSSIYWIDLGYSDVDWVSWSRYVDVYLLTPVPADLDYMLPAWTPMAGRPDN